MMLKQELEARGYKVVRNLNGSYTVSKGNFRFEDTSLLRIFKLIPKKKTKERILEDKGNHGTVA